jgi:hypothetical protein
MIDPPDQSIDQSDDDGIIDPPDQSIPSSTDDRLIDD